MKKRETGALKAGARYSIFLVIGAALFSLGAAFFTQPMPPSIRSFLHGAMRLPHFLSNKAQIDGTKEFLEWKANLDIAYRSQKAIASSS